MLKTMAQVLPLALAADISPSGLLFVMLILSDKDNGKRKSLSFVVGAFAFLIVLGVAVMLTFKAVAGQSAHPTKLSGIIDILLGLLILVIVAVSVWRKPVAHPNDRQKRKPPYLALGFLFMITNVSTLIPFIAASKIIASAKLGIPDTSAVFAAVIGITMFMVAFPVFISYAAPKKSDKILGPIQTFMRARGKQVADIYFLAMAAYLIARGLMVL